MAQVKSKSPSTTAPEEKTSTAEPTSTELRVLLTNEEASVIIGRKGANATRIRTETEVFLTILKTEAPSPERLMVVKGQPEALTAAVRLIAELLTEQKAEKTSATPEKPFALKILVHKFLAGCIIGPSGTIVRDIQTATGARISLSVEPLPNSTDKVCSISGPPEAISAGTARVLTQLAENPLRPGCSVVPYVVNAFQNSNYFPPFPLGAFPFGQSSFATNPTLPFAPGQFGRFPPLQNGAVLPTFTRTEKIVIPSACAGSVIGRNGSIIKDIKAQSGTKISLAEASESGDRIVTITGSLQGIQLASFLIRQRVESQQQVQAQQAKKPSSDASDSHVDQSK